MDNLSEKLTQLLSDSGSMKQIMEMASALSGSAGQTPQLPPDLLEKLSRAMTRTERSDEKQRALVQALLPYLRPRRQAQLERALEIAHFSHLASIAYQAETSSSHTDGTVHV